MKINEQLEIDEGFSKIVYLCPAGKKSIGFGYNLDANSLVLSSNTISNYFSRGISENEARLLLCRCISDVQKKLRGRIKGFSELNTVRQDILTNMAFNMGVAGLLDFHKMLRAIEDNDFNKAADEMKNSKWFHQVGMRSKRLEHEMRTGVSK